MQAAVNLSCYYIHWLIIWLKNQHANVCVVVFTRALVDLLETGLNKFLS
jgi:hypothetical protein